MDLFNYYILFFVCIFGVCLGSFYNVVILRSLTNESIVLPPSKCPKCSHKLYPWHNIPLISYILLRGKCYFCHEKISIQYPVVEFFTMVLFALTYIKYGLTLKALVYIITISCFLIMTVTDIKERLADCNLAIAVAIIGIIYNGITNGINGILSSALGLIAASLILEGIARLGYIFVKTRAMGEADTYVAASLGAVFGIPASMTVLLYAFVSSMLFIVPVFLYKQFKAGNYMLCVIAIIFGIAAFLFNYVSKNYLTYGILLVSGITLAVIVMKSAKIKENRNYLPYIPAFFAGLLLYIF